jgi:flavin reductase (DIM6/NTAB) family NADH-FMN oxidoreductase RutF
MSVPITSPVAVSADEFRDVISHFATGVTVITAVDAGERFGSTASAVSSLSLEPPMLLVCLNRQSATGACVSRAGRFAVNILDEHQGELAKRFASKSPDKFAGIATTEGGSGEPLLGGALAHVECRVVEEVSGGHAPGLPRRGRAGEGRHRHTVGLLPRPVRPSRARRRRACLRRHARPRRRAPASDRRTARSRGDRSQRRRAAQRRPPGPGAARRRRPRRTRRERQLHRPAADLRRDRGRVPRPLRGPARSRGAERRQHLRRGSRRAPKAHGGNQAASGGRQSDVDGRVVRREPDLPSGDDQARRQRRPHGRLRALHRARA